MDDYYLNSLFLADIFQIDKSIFYTINCRWAIPFADHFFILMRTAYFWYPLYALLVLFVIWKMKKEAWKFVVGAIVAVGVSDSISSHILKPLFGRVRPCRDETLDFVVRNLVPCGMNGSFPSSHASNHFTLAFFFFLSLKMYCKQWSYLFFLWAILICYAQIYVGVHYPFDILGGMLLGSTIGIICFYWYNKLLRLEKL